MGTPETCRGRWKSKEATDFKFTVIHVAVKNRCHVWSGPDKSPFFWLLAKLFHVRSFLTVFFISPFCYASFSFPRSAQRRDCDLQMSVAFFSKICFKQLAFLPTGLPDCTERSRHQANCWSVVLLFRRHVTRVNGMGQEQKPPEACQSWPAQETHLLLQADNNRQLPLFLWPMYKEPVNKLVRRMNTVVWEQRKGIPALNNKSKREKTGLPQVDDNPQLLVRMCDAWDAFLATTKYASFPLRPHWTRLNTMTRTLKRQRDFSSLCFF